MKTNKKKIFSADSFGVLLLVVLTVFAGYMGCTKRFSENVTEEKVTANSKNYNRSGYSDYDYDYDYDDEYYYNYGYNDNYYDDYYYDDYNYGYNYNDYNDYYYDDYDYGYSDYNYGYNYGYNNNKYNTPTYTYNPNSDDYSYNYTGYNNYDGTNYYNYGYNQYNDTTAPTIKYTSSDIIKQYQSYDPWEGVSTYHTKFGDVTDYIEIVYNNVDINIPGEYSIVYKACNYPGSEYCRTATKMVRVKENEDPKYYNSKAPVWSNTGNKKCFEGDTSCKTNRINEPTATDPYSKRELDVTLIEGDVDIYTPGTYVLVYYAETQNGISGTTTKVITIQRDYDDDDDRYNNNYNNNYNSQRKYVSNHYSSYYDDGMYRGSLTPDYNNNNQVVKYIDDYKWTNNVRYTYKCTIENGYGVSGWQLVSTDTSDDHPTYQYNNGGFTGTLNKTNFYCVPGKGCEDDLNRNLGTCKNVGETKQVTRTWVGVYAGNVYTNRERTYSGYVYRYN